MQDTKTEEVPAYSATTREFARLNGIQATSLTVHLCKHGSYYGIKPKKLVNGRLLWPAITLDRKGGQ